MAVAVVTGGGTGLGLALARRLTARFSAVLIVGRRGALLAEAAASAPLAGRGRLVPVEGDVSTEEGCSAVAAAAAAGSGGVALVVHNAAVLGPVKPALELSREELRATFAVNVEPLLHLTRALRPHMAPACRLLSISSGAAHSAIVGWTAYCVSKAAAFAAYQMLREELAPEGILVGSARPGVVDTPMQTVVRGEGKPAFPSHSRFVAMKAAADASAGAGASGGDAAAAAGAAPAPRTSHPPPRDALDEVDNAATFLDWLCCESGDREFSYGLKGAASLASGGAVSAVVGRDGEWDIRDEAHHHHWVGRPLLPAWAAAEGGTASGGDGSSSVLRR